MAGENDPIVFASRSYTEYRSLRTGETYGRWHRGKPPKWARLLCRWAVLAIVASLVVGCETVAFRENWPDGRSMVGVGVGVFTKPDFKLTKAADGSVNVEYHRDVATDAIQAAVGAAVTGAVKAAK